jgi:hypothetical protein
MDTGLQSETEISDIWKNDLIGRKSEAEFIKKFILAKLELKTSSGDPRSFVLNIDAPWGSGKTQFLESFEKQLHDEGYLVARVNAWIDDHSDDPLTSVLAAIENVVGKTPPSEQSKIKLQSVKRNAGKIILTAARGFGKQIAKKYIGDMADDITVMITDDASIEPKLDNTTIDEAIEAGGTAASEKIFDDVTDQLLTTFKEEKRALQGFRLGFEKLMRELGSADPKHANMFILIDELDRCRPDYAIRMLERIKHLFSTSGAIFIVATDTSQLHHAVRAVYGQGFDSETYLLRFFDRSYHFPQKSRLNFTSERLGRLSNREKLNLPESEDLSIYFDHCASHFHLTLRDTEQVIEMLSDSLLTWDHSSKVEALYLIPLLMLMKKDAAMFFRFSTGSQTNDDMTSLSQLLKFSLGFQRDDGSRVTAWQSFAAFWHRRRWTFKEVRQANTSGLQDRFDLFINDAVYNELLERIKSGANKDSTVTVLSRYERLVESIAAFSD